MTPVGNKTRITSQPQPASVPTLTDLIRVFRKINNHDNFGALTNTILAEVARAFGAEAAGLLLVNKSTGDLEIAAVKHVPEEAITQYLQAPARALSLAECFAQVPEGAAPRDCPETVSRLAAAGYPNHDVLPIRIQDKTIGYLTLAATGPLFSKPEKRETLRLVLEYIAQSIENAYFIYQLQQQNAHLELMMTKLQNTQHHLKRAEKMALVGQIAATVAHEIRNPLTIVGTNLQLVFEKMNQDHPERELYETMIGKVRTVDQTIKEMLVFSRPLKIQPRSLHLANALNRVISFISHKYQDRNIRIEQELPPELPSVYLDEEQTQRVFINLLLNAYNFSPPDSTVQVRATHQSGEPWVTLVFSDQGTGIAPEHLQKIFEPFFTTRMDGTGLGLFMVKHVLEEMNGAIEVQSSADNGTEFRLRLPLAT